MEIVVKGRHREVSERFRTHATAKLERLERYDHSVVRLEVEVCHEPNPRLAGRCERVELTCRHRGPVVRAEAAASDPYAALDLAVGKLQERLRRNADRRRHRGGRHGGAASPAPAASPVVPMVALLDGDPERRATAGGAPAGPEADEALDGVLGDSPVVVREKVHEAAPMTVDEALHRMELVGHDFFMFCESSSGQPCVVYRRLGYSYGLLRLVVATPEVETPAPGRSHGAAVAATG